MNHIQKVAIVAGEASGDQHAAELIKEMRAKDPSIQFTGIGGSQMQQQGCHILYPSSKIAVVGFIEVLFHLPSIREAWKIITKHLQETPPDILILVDYPGFNLKLARFAKSQGIKVTYYISPQVWAWKKNRVKKMSKTIDLMAVIFPFEVDFYKQQHIPVRYVGHPLLKTAIPSTSKGDTREKLGIPKKHRIIGLFPGSRRGEIKRHLPIMLKSAALWLQENPNTTFLIPIAQTLSYDDFKPYLKDYKLPLVLAINDNVYDNIQCCDSIIVASGTATLQIAIMQVPMVIIYKLSFLTYILARMLIQIPYFGLCNVVAGKIVVKELAQFSASPKNIIEELNKIKNDPAYKNRIIRGLAKVKHKLQIKPKDTLSDLLLERL